ncbi:efflux RND transporter periplasmic adaptor subunit [Lacisediminimonas profundi]|uniref:efflux RND transporter periplasmic adaptor subunit n=1 Tax=Lacisediminimonas profundi TaxID=2603856 RepID=UPI001F4F7936|nr:efflux RND transporter periplasmic adaptor subunit [Lacisediminimonas profundi]
MTPELMRPSPSALRRGLLATAMLLALAACKPNEPAKPAASAAAAADPNLVQVSADMQRQLKIAPAANALISQSERIAGRIDFDEQRVARIGANVTGRVTELKGTLGQSVRAGDLLAQLHSAELGAAQLAYLRARAQVDLHRRNVERAKLLLSADVIGAAELQKRESELAIAEAETRAAADQLRVQGMTARAIEAISKTGAINSTSQVVASASGIVVERKVALGQVIQPADALFTIADLSRLWVTAQVPEQQIAGIQAGQTVSIEVPALQNSRLTGKLVYVGDTVNVENRTVTVRTEVDNADRSLKPAMLATMIIRTRPVERLVVPSAAVVREDDEDHVLQEISAGKYRLVKVKLLPEQDKLRPVESGIKAGDRVVIEGAFHLNNERKRMQAGGQS